MYVFVITLHIILCVLLVFIILMQPGKGADVSSAFGGGSSSQLFGAAGPGNFLTKGTGIFAGLFMVTSVALALYSSDSARSGGDVSGALKNVMQEGEEGGGFGTGAAAPEKLEPAPIPSPVPPAETPAPGTPAAAPAPAGPAGEMVPGGAPPPGTQSAPGSVPSSGSPAPGASTPAAPTAPQSGTPSPSK